MCEPFIFTTHNINIYIFERILCLRCFLFLQMKLNILTQSFTDFDTEREKKEPTKNRAFCASFEISHPEKEKKNERKRE